MRPYGFGMLDYRRKRPTLVAIAEPGPAGLTRIDLFPLLERIGHLGPRLVGHVATALGLIVRRGGGE